MLLVFAFAFDPDLGAFAAAFALAFALAFSRQVQSSISARKAIPGSVFLGLFGLITAMGLRDVAVARGVSRYVLVSLGGLMGAGPAKVTGIMISGLRSFMLMWLKVPDLEGLARGDDPARRKRPAPRDPRYDSDFEDGAGAGGAGGAGAPPAPPPRPPMPPAVPAPPGPVPGVPGVPGGEGSDAPSGRRRRARPRPLGEGEGEGRAGPGSGPGAGSRAVWPWAAWPRGGPV